MVFLYFLSLNPEQELTFQSKVVPFQDMKILFVYFPLDTDIISTNVPDSEYFPSF